MPKSLYHPLIFTDLDGTLLEHSNYSAEPADRLIRQFEDQSIANVIPITSKTQAEWQSLRRSLRLDIAISVTENGSVIHTSSGFPFRHDKREHRIISGTSYSDILKRVEQLPSILRRQITGFHDMSAEAVAEATGLSVDEAKRAKKRDATEPFLWSGSATELDMLKAICADADIQIQRGGRFFHFTGKATKRWAMERIKDAFVSRTTDREIITIALGDGPNDLAMIEAADFGVIMPNPEGVTIFSDKRHVRNAPEPGPKGWVVAVEEILKELGINLPKS